jgi:hypothetical protein
MARHVLRDCTRPLEVVVLSAQLLDLQLVACPLETLGSQHQEGSQGHDSNNGRLPARHDQEHNEGAKKSEAKSQEDLARMLPKVTKALSKAPTHAGRLLRGAVKVEPGSQVTFDLEGRSAFGMELSRTPTSSHASSWRTWLPPSCLAQTL